MAAKTSSINEDNSFPHVAINLFKHYILNYILEAVLLLVAAYTWYVFLKNIFNVIVYIIYMVVVIVCYW